MKKKINLIFCGEKKLSLDCLKFILKNYNQINLLAIATRKKSKVWWGEQYLRNFAIKKKIKLIKSKDILNYKNVTVFLLYFQSFLESYIFYRQNNQLMPPKYKVLPLKKEYHH